MVAAKLSGVGTGYINNNALRRPAAQGKQWRVGNEKKFLVLGWRDSEMEQVFLRARGLGVRVGAAVLRRLRRYG